ncbi:SDR family NAD(P)-dependent oxidoreductase [Thermomonospora cellulosilytica]|uniref:NAD(P)-dependent dehydrogenase (Short-subunit alcohol dehydrogenase family) n=1 Tax=Thermomonospora cellulosilytica TaxID=1411118 RepID=A0A7W3N2A7_9ACTN|nr:SDR family NAD(P)-dependent oxidoreductase [Thermomonospora cellulosilytica]MBA9006263.1 NAD(P)-dependent dehydrogenase (short-subunit alcohol dehydrogenase family) [Thermomonospora cellulosilytica]
MDNARAGQANPSQTIAVTGANRGIGHAVAEALLRQGHEVVLVCRDRERGEAARSRLAALGSVRLVVGDLSGVRAIRATAEALRDACPRLDVLVHNAGLWPSRRVLNEDGLEQAFVTNHLAPFLLNLELEDLLTASAARVVQVSAGLYVKGKADPDRTPTGLDFHPMRTYADTKLCNLMLVPLFAERWQDAGVTINAVHPGVIRTGLGDRRGPLGWLLKAVKLTWKSPRTGAGPVVRLATSAEVAGVTGRYFQLDEEHCLEPVARDRDLARRLWTRAAELAGVPHSPPAARDA